ncbi:hypothetical protein IID24_03250 [Patescibacteria group bacterium]|nr:hypothetical protein [Patescibacteria group bacterium]
MNSPILCGHANEVPNTCPCPEDCYCRVNACLPKRDEKKTEAQRVADIYLKNSEYDDPCDLGMLISERVEYYSDRWSDDGIRFDVIRLLLNECQKRWASRKIADSWEDEGGK